MENCYSIKAIFPENKMLIVNITMTATVTTAFWSMTINNYDETSLALVRNGYPDYCREIIHTLEEGKEGTPHIQAWIKLQRQQRLSFLKKLFPRGHFKPLTSAEYVHNTKMYAQKNDETTQSAHVHTFNDPTGTVEALIPKVIHYMWNEYGDCDDRDVARMYAERDMVEENWRLAKIFVSAVYKQMWKQFGAEMMSGVSKERDTHTHTHSDEKFSHEGGITDDASESEDTEVQEGSDTEEYGPEEDGEDYSERDGSNDEADAEGWNFGGGSETDE